MMACDECGFVFNQSFEFSNLSYGENYDNTQICSNYFSNYVDHLITNLIEKSNVRNSKIVEIGCGKGSFLRKLVEHEKFGNVGYGFDPSYVGPDSDFDGRLKFFNRYYGKDCDNISADIVICRHVIEHVPFPLDFLNNIQNALKNNSPKARVFFETPCVDWILRNNVIWDFFYEHCSLFYSGSLTAAFESAGFCVNSVRHLFHDQYIWLEATVSAENPPVEINPGSIPKLAKKFNLLEKDLIEVWKNKVQVLMKKGKVAIWGAGAKGVTFINLLDPKREIIDCIVDLNPNKQGRYSPGTGHPIVKYQELKKRGVKNIILMNPNYYEENKALLREANIGIELIKSDS